MGIQPPAICGTDNRRGLLAVVGVVAAALLLTVSVTGGIAADQASQTSESRIGHVIVADAGSSHTDFSLYRFVTPGQSGSNLPRPEP